MTGRILTPLKGGDLERLHPSRRRDAEAMYNAIVSARQAAEWGMGSIDKAYHQLCQPLRTTPTSASFA